MLSPTADIPQTNAPDANNDYGTFRNDGTPGDHTGTPLIATWPNDFYGAFLSVLKAADISPNNQVENTSASQFLTALQTLIETGGETVRTGQVKFEMDDSAQDGWVLMDDTTIGDSTSNAAHVGDAYEALFTLIWNKTSNADCPIFGSDGSPSTRGANAAADWSAHKQMSLPKQVGRAAAAAGTPTALITFAAAQHSDTFTIDSTLTPFTVDDITDILELSDSMSFLPGQAVRLDTSGVLPSPLTTGTDYYPISIDDTHFKLAASSSDAENNIAIDITDAGSGINSILINAITIPDTTFYNTGTKVQLATTGVLPSPLMIMTDYYVIEVNGTTLQLAGSLSDANNGIFINIEDVGTGSHTIATDEVFTVSAGQSFPTGSKVQLLTHGTLPSPFSIGINYYMMRLDASHFKLAATRANSVGGDSLSFSTLGSGIHNVRLMADISYVVGQSTGEQSHTQTVPELATHNHGVSKYQYQYPQSGSSTTCWSGVVTANSNNAGSSTPFNVMQPTTFYNVFMKL